jgi:hypothetical protein
LRIDTAKEKYSSTNPNGGHLGNELVRRHEETTIKEDYSVDEINKT